MDRREMLEMTAGRVTELAESVSQDADISNPEELYGAILLSLVREFRSVLSEKEMAIGLNSVAMQILQGSADLDQLLRNSLPDNRPENPEMN